ncbi:hypothetical protein PR202_gb14638 [Eleusine coracana subsp. coracana]|uniref:DUF4378 domain-containing protein n=1 Tax=Eleusine coracana subsp. coracana TaxID=191504 RepID=A0AAV5EXA8_ELECO|nr:hypothetical protein QOZ80_4BG0337880 [Eleusine coracana subsp. coracana]GJN26686.1 hypothetical protein PR202_gb14638 [Eleusine coracana subsp. coracana]
MDTESEARPLMLKEWLELESSAELSRDGFGCYPRHLAADLRSASARRRNGGDVIARVSAAVRAALLLRAPPSGDAGARLPRSISRRLRAGFWKKRRGEREETNMRVLSCSAAVACGRRDGAPSSPAMSPRRPSWEGRRPSVDGGRRSHEAEVAGSECATACRVDEEREQEQRLSPVSVMDFPGMNEDDGNNGTCKCEDDDETMSPAFARSMANIQRASQLLLQKIRQFEQLAELDPSDVDAATTATEDASCHVAESDIEDEAVQDLLGILQVSSPVAACRFQKLLEDFFRDGLASSYHRERSDDDSETTKSLLAVARSWLDGRHCTQRSDWKSEVEEIERLGWWRRFREDEQEMLAVDVEGSIFWSLMEELVDDLC